MDEMTLVKDLGMALASTRHAPDELRQRVLAATASTRPDRHALGPPRPARRRRRRWLVPATVAAAAAVLVAVTFLGRGGPVEPVDPHADASRLLLSAAYAALEGPDLAPGPDQFVYVESVESGVVLEYTGGLPGKVRDRLQLTGSHRETTERRAWLSVDGTRDGLVRLRPRGSAGGWEDLRVDGCRNGRLQNAPCNPQPAAHVSDLPTDAANMHTYLYRHSNGSNPPDVQAFVTAGDLIRDAYLPPAALAAVFQAVAQIPGVRVVPHVTDAAGRPGIAVAREDSGLRNELIFDAKTHQYLGERQIVVGYFEDQPKGTVMSQSARLRVAIVDQAGQQP